MKYIEKLTVLVEETVAQELPEKFGLIIDVWTDSGTSTHYFAIFACYPDKDPSKRKCPLLAFSPLLTEEDFTAEAHLDFIVATLNIFNRSLDSLSFVTGAWL